MLVFLTKIFHFNFVTISGGEFHKVHDNSVFECFVINLVTISESELHKVHEYCVFDCIFSLFQEVSYIKCMIIVCLTVSFHYFRR